MKILLFVTVCVVGLGSIRSECPNGCSGSGTCGPKDMCTCFKNYQGNDCSEKTCPFGYAHVDSPKGDLNMDQSLSHALALENSQVYPYTTAEKYDPSAVTSEGHFYMECSNRGICDRSAGVCQCFPGHDGSSCQRASCPNSCSGHGTCESISELATDAGGKLFHVPLPGGATTYSLWDAKVSYGCKCDPWYTGSDCSERLCKVGVDPLYEAAGTEILDVFTIIVYGKTAAAESTVADSWFRLRMFDYWGESYVTDKIVLEDMASTTARAAEVQALIEGLPNSAFSSVTCAYSTGTLVFVKATVPTDHKGMVLSCQLGGNPGKIRLPEIESSFIGTGIKPALPAEKKAVVVGSSIRGEDIDWCGALSSTTVDKIEDGSRLSVVINAADTNINPSDGSEKLVKIKNQYLVLNAGGQTTTLTSAFAWAHDAILTGSLTPFFYSSATVTKSTVTITDVAVGDLKAKLSGTSGNTYVVGDYIFLENQIFIVTGLSDDTTNFYIHFDRPFAGKAADGTSITGATITFYEITPPTTNTYTYVSECSGRGICDRSTGVCSCFRGYTNDNCDTQNTLSL